MTRAHGRPDRRRSTQARLPALMLALALGASLSPAAAGAAPSLRWSAPASLGAGRAPSAVSCASESLCVAVDSEGEALGSSDPTAAEPSWSAAAIDTGAPPGESLTAVSCAPGGPCVAVDGRGDAFESPEPGVSAWSSTALDAGTALTGVSCATASLCVAVDAVGAEWTSTNPGSGVWSKASIDVGHRLTAVSCSSQSLCVAVDSAGDVLSSANPAGGGATWHAQRLDFGELLAVSCWAAGACVAVDSAGDALASADPVASAPTWSLTPIDGERPTGVACASSGLCVAVDARGEALASDDPAATIPLWSASSIDSQALVGVSCLPGGFCMALDTGGRSLGGRVPSPLATTLTPAEVTNTSATLAGAVDPNDAVLGACSFEYGTSVSYTQSVSCAVLPAASGGAQAVAASLSSLSPNTTYHYRVYASSPAGASAGADEQFTTAISAQVALIHPNPSITGTPADGQLLTCHPGTPAGASAQLSYAWLRDLIPIAGATGATYAVKGQDTGHHLQCQVTATDGGGSATAKSAFVTIPIGGAPASAGETAVGAATFKGGKLTVPITCSTQASGGCEVALRLTVVKTLDGARVIAIAARARRSAHRSAAALRHLTVTLASERVHLPQGAHRALLLALGATGRRLLASERHFSAYLYVSGTVIGVIEAQLARQLLALSAPAHGASTHVARRR
jgi:hypothetical protein